jgi:hypothetical protein
MVLFKGFASPKLGAFARLFISSILVRASSTTCKNTLSYSGIGPSMYIILMISIESCASTRSGNVYPADSTVPFRSLRLTR